MNELACRYGVHPSQITRWKQQLEEGVQEIFDNGHQRRTKEGEELKVRLYREIGQLKVELGWLKSRLSPSLEARRVLVEREHPQIRLRRQCTLLGLNRSTANTAYLFWSVFLMVIHMTTDPLGASPGNPEELAADALDR